MPDPQPQQRISPGSVCTTPKLPSGRRTASSSNAFDSTYLSSSLQVGDAVVDHLDLLLHHRHPPGKAVVLPHLPGQLLQLRIRYGLPSAVADEHPSRVTAPVMRATTISVISSPLTAQ